MDKTNFSILYHTTNFSVLYHISKFQIMCVLFTSRARYDLSEQDMIEKLIQNEIN